MTIRITYKVSRLLVPSFKRFNDFLHLLPARGQCKIVWDIFLYVINKVLYPGCNTIWAIWCGRAGADVQGMWKGRLLLYLRLVISLEVDIGEGIRGAIYTDGPSYEDLLGSASLGIHGEIK